MSGETGEDEIRVVGQLLTTRRGRFEDVKSGRFLAMPLLAAFASTLQQPEHQSLSPPKVSKVTLSLNLCSAAALSALSARHARPEP